MKAHISTLGSGACIPLRGHIHRQADGACSALRGRGGEVDTKENFTIDCEPI